MIWLLAFIGFVVIVGGVRLFAWLGDIHEHVLTIEENLRGLFVPDNQNADSKAAPTISPIAIIGDPGGLDKDARDMLQRLFGGDKK